MIFIFLPRDWDNTYHSLFSTNILGMDRIFQGDSFCVLLHFVLLAKISSLFLFPLSKFIDYLTCFRAAECPNIWHRTSTTFQPLFSYNTRYVGISGMNCHSKIILEYLNII